MQIHELNQRQSVNELDIAGPGGLVAGAKAALGALKQPGGAKDLGRTVTPGQSQGLASTADLTQSDFAQRMQTVKNQAAIKQVAANLQKQWSQTSKTLPTAGPATAPGTTTPASGYSSVKTNAPAGIPSVGKSNLPTPTKAAPATPASTSTAAGTYNKKTGAATMGGKPMVAAKDLPPHIQKQIGALAETITQPMTEAVSLGQLTDWYKKSVIPKSMAAASAKYLENAVIKTALNKIVATADNPSEQSKAFEDLVAATSVVSQTISAENPQLAAAGATRAAVSSPAAQAAKTNLVQAAGMTPSQIDAIKKITSALGPVSSRDPATVNSLRALGFNVQ